MSSPSSTRRALLISSPYNRLVAADAALTRMCEFLRKQRFDDRRCIVGPAATRAAIIAGFDSLIAGTGPDDVVVVYYAGHGGLFPDRVGDKCEPHPVLEPMDIADSDEHHYNGLLGAEVRWYLRALGRLCDNVTAIFDCCHASGLVSTDEVGDEEAERAVARDVAKRAGERIAARRLLESKAVMRSHRPSATGVVRLVASSASERAYAYPNRRMLVFTDILVKVLEEYAPAAGHTWDQVIREVRTRVQDIRPEQRPGVEGARERVPFTTTSVPTPTDHFHVQRRGQRLMVAGGRACGIEKGDWFELVPYAGDLVVARAQAVVVEATHAILEPDRGGPRLPNALFARRIRVGSIRLAAHLASSDAPADQSHARARGAALAEHGFVLGAPAVADVPPGYIDLLDELIVGSIHHTAPQRVARLAADDPEIADELLGAARRLQRWAGLAAQLVDPGLGPLAGCYTWAWGRIVHGELEPLQPGAAFAPCERMGLHIYNPGRVGALHVHAFRIRADRTIDAWRDADGGLAVKTGHELPLELGCERDPAIPGPQREWLVVAIADGAFELGSLTTNEAFGAPMRSEPGDARHVEFFGVPYVLATA